MAFDWTNFFDSYGIEYRSSGKNVKRGWHNVNCPFCGDDTGFHMGTNPDTGGWACWRNKEQHKGRSVPRLIDALLGCGWKRACEIAGDWEEPGPVDAANLSAAVAALDSEEDVRKPQTVRWPSRNFHELFRGHHNSHLYEDYLRGRGFGDDAERVADLYDIRYAYAGDWSGRLILPITGKKGIYGWQGRAISKKAELRYLSYPDSSHVKKLIFNFGRVYKAKYQDTLVIVEGPVDAYKVDFYGRGEGIRCVGTLGTSFVEAQVALLWELCSMFDRTLVLFDAGAESAAYDLASRLSMFAPAVGFVPDKYEDAGALPADKVVPVVRRCLA